MERILVLVLVFSAVLALGFKLVKMFRGKETGCACGKDCIGEKCGIKKNEDV